MSTLAQMREGLEHLRENLAEGWRQLRMRAGHALTRFTPTRGNRREMRAADEPAGDHVMRWALLAAEVMEDDDAVEVRLEVPGMALEDLDLSVRDQYLVVRGEKHMQRDEARGNYFLMERAYGAFERAVPLPAPVRDDGADARYRDGVLLVRLPKAGNARRRRIDVQPL